MRSFPNIVLLLIFLHLTVACAAPAFAAVSQQDFRVMMRAIGFLQSPPSGDVVFAIVYDPGNPESVEESRQVQGALGNGYSLGGMILHPKLVPVSAIGGIDGAAFVFVTNGTGAYHGMVAKMIMARKILSLSLDKSCVEKGDCALYINTVNRVEIIINKSSAEASGISFKPTFMLLVTTL